MGNTEFDKYFKDGIKVYKLRDGLNDIRILPPTWANPKHYGLDIYLHYGVGPDRQTYLDLTRMLDKPDPIAEERDVALREGDEDLAKDLESKRRTLVWMVDRLDESEGVQAWAMPWTVDRDLSTVSVDSKTKEVLPIDHPEDGYDVQFDKKGAKRNTKYTGIQISRRSSPLGNQKWLDYAIDNPLPDQLVYYSYDEIAKEFGSAGAHRDRLQAARDREELDGRDDGRGRDRGRDSGRERGRDSRDVDGRGSRDRDRDVDRSRPSDRDDRSDRDNNSDSDRETSRGREDRPSRNESRDRDGRSDRDAGRDRDSGSDRDGRGDSRRDSSRSGTRLDWGTIHEMTGIEMEDLVKEERLNINPNKANSDADLADWICEELKLTKPAGRERAKLKEDDPRDRLREMRNSRER